MAQFTLSRRLRRRGCVVGQRGPASVGLEARTIALRELLQSLHAGVDAAGARIGHRTAAKRREAGAEDHTGIDQIGILDNAFAQAGDTLIDQRQDQPVGEVSEAAPSPAGCPLRPDSRTTLPSCQR